MRITYGFVYHLIDELDYAKGNVSGFSLQDLETHYLRVLIILWAHTKYVQAGTCARLTDSDCV